MNEFQNIIDLGLSGMALFSVAVMAVILYRFTKNGKTNGNGDPVKELNQHIKEQGFFCNTRLEKCTGFFKESSERLASMEAKIDILLNGGNKNG